MMDRETWLRRILEATRDLADERYQERVWVRGEGPEVDSSTEAVCRLVDDYDLATFLDEAAKNAWVSNGSNRGLAEARRRARPSRQQRRGRRRCNQDPEPGMEKNPQACQGDARSLHNARGQRLTAFGSEAEQHPKERSTNRWLRPRRGS